jgi:membrane associated rhomboid family serine protease
MLYGGSSHTILDIDKIIGKGEIGRLLSSQFIFSTPSQAVFAIIMLYTCRLFERQLGTKKYGAFFFSTLLITLFLNVLFAFIFKSCGIRFAPAAGPYFFLFAQMALFHSMK